MLLSKIVSRTSRFQLNTTKQISARSLFGVILITLASACSDTGVSTDSDTNNNTIPPTQNTNPAITPVVGTWNLPDNWKGMDNDEAYLVIRSPINGTADAIVYDYDDVSTGFGNNCYYIDGAEGTVSLSASNELLLDLSTFPDASLSIRSGSLTIEYTVGPETGSGREIATVVATKAAITEIDLQPICEF